ncbi:MAG TPA: Gfo/Idh/MocA family oxidoreductase [Planctomycetota bacterium]|nr:Gfo/Idh/MocA family oxidoreductase [Planctomycetota bacterium]
MTAGAKPLRAAESVSRAAVAGAGPVIRAAVIGAGHLGRIHARIYAETPGVKLVAVVDPREDRAGAIAERYEARASARPDDLPGDVDVVSVATPTSTHAATAIPLLRRGIAVLVEKPIAATLEDADALLDAARAGGAMLSVGHSERFNPGVSAIREMRIRPRFVEAHRLAPFSFRSQDVGVVLDLMVHDLDLLLHLVDPEIVSVDAAGGSVLTDREDLANARLRFRNGCIANVTASRVSLEPLRRMRFFSPDSYVSVDFGKRYAIAVRKGPKFDAERGRLSQLDPEHLPDPRSFVFGGLLDVREERLSREEEPLRLELEAFVRAVRGEAPNFCSGEEGRRALAAAIRVQTELERAPWRAA